MNTASSAGDDPANRPAVCLHDAEPHEVEKHLEQGRFFWLDLEDPSDEKLRRLADKVGLHPLTVEDARTFEQRPKLDEYEGYVFLVVFGSIPPPAPANRCCARCT